MTVPGASAAGAAARQAHAAEHLFARYRDQIFRFCLARLRSREEAEDAVQNTFMRVHMALQRGVVPEYEAAWLYKIAHNVCLSRYESTARRARVETPYALDDDELPVAAREVSHDELAGLSEALEAMPLNLRQAILLREWQGLSYAEIAEAMGLTVPAVETLLFRARRHLAAALEQGTPVPKRRTAAVRLLDLLGLGTVLRRLRELLAGGVTAKVVAGATLVALTGGGVELGVSLADAPPAQRGPVASMTVPTFAHAQPAAATHAGTASAPATASPARTQSAGTRRMIPLVAASPGAAAFVLPVAVAEPANRRQPVLPGVQVPVAAPSPPTGTTTVPAVEVPAPPTLSTPTPDLPTVTVPTVQAPTVDVPTVEVPTVETPTVGAPAVDTPTVSVPAVGDALPGVVGGVVTVP